MRNGWDTNFSSVSSSSDELVTESTVREQVQGGHDHLSQEDGHGEVVEGDGSLGLTTSSLRTLDNLGLSVQVSLVVTAVGSDTDSQHSTGSEGEGEVQEVQSEQDQWPSQWLEEVSKDTVQTVRENTIGRCKHTVVHTRGMSSPSSYQVRNQTNGNNQETKVHYT